LLGVKLYITLDFAKYPLLASTLLNNYKATHLINNKYLLKLGSFIKASYNKCVEAGSSSFPILKRGTKVIKKALNGTSSLNSANLVLNNIIVIKGFYVNIILKARLYKVKV
jgi:hypothetical protein